MDSTKIVIDYLNTLSYLKRGHIKVVQVAKDTNISMYDSSRILEDLVYDNKLQKRFEVIDKDTALNYGCFKSIEDVPQVYKSDDGLTLTIGENASIKVFYRYPNAHESIQ